MMNIENRFEASATWKTNRNKAKTIGWQRFEPTKTFYVRNMGSKGFWMTMDKLISKELNLC